MPAEWLVRSVTFGGSNKRWDQSYALQMLGYPTSNIWLGAYIDDGKVAQWDGTRLIDRTYTGLRAGAVLLATTASAEHVYAIAGENTPQYTVDRLPMGGTEWEPWDPPQLPDNLSWDHKGPFVFNGKLYSGEIAINEPDMPFHAGRARQLYSIPLDAGPGGSWTQIYNSYQGFFFCNNSHTFGVNWDEDLYVAPGRREQGVNDLVWVGTTPETSTGVEPIGLSVPLHSSAFGTALEDGTIVFAVDNTGDGYGFNITEDGQNFDHITPNVIINNSTGRQNLGSDGFMLVWVKKTDVFASGQILYGPPANEGWVTPPIGLVDAQAIYWDRVGLQWFLTHNGKVSLVNRDFQSIRQQADVLEQLGYGVTFDYIAKLPLSMTW